MQSRPRVTIIGLHYPPESTGNAPYTGALARGLQSRNFPVHVLTGHPHYPEWVVRDGYGQWVRRETVEGVRVTRFRHFVPKCPNGLKRLLSEISFGLRLMFADWESPDVVVLVSPALFSTSMGVIRAWLDPTRPAVVVWVQDLYSLGVTEMGAGGSLVVRLMKWIEAGTLRAACAVVVIHSRFSEYIEGALRVNPERIHVVRNWTHLKPRAAQVQSEVRTQYGWNSLETVVLHAGNMGAKQGLENVIEAARLAEEHQYPIRFVLLGDGNQRASLEMQADGVDRVQFLDPIDDEAFQAALASADILLVNEKPGVSEMSVPSKLTSYFDSGTVVIASTDPNGVTAHEIEASGGGHIVQSGDPQALLEACLGLRAHPEDAAAFGRSGRRYREDALGEEAAIERFAEMIVGLPPTKNRWPFHVRNTIHQGEN